MEVDWRFKATEVSASEADLAQQAKSFTGADTTDGKFGTLGYKSS